MNLSGNTILITGGASGIGYGLTKRFIEEGNKVLICGRRQEVLQKVKAEFPSIDYFVCDLAIENERNHLVEWIKTNHSDLNVLVNNAGIQHWMNVSEENFFEKAKQEIAINIEAPLHLTALFLELNSLKTVLNVTSGLSFVPLIKTPVYSATKAFFHSFTLSLRALLESKNIEVIEIVPPALNTHLGGVGLHDYAPPVSDFIAAIFQQIAEGKNQLTFGMSEGLSKADPEGLQKIFERMNAPEN